MLVPAIFLFSVAPASHAAYKRVAQCGNMITEPTEQCDLGVDNGIAGSGCSSTCQIISICGNNIAESGEQCDNDALPNTTCTSNCMLVIPANCGDGIVQPWEDCEPSISPASCNLDCTFSRCNDGKLRTLSGEQCDARGQANTCNSNCHLSICGDSVVNTASGEACDDGAQTAACNGNCQFSACGDDWLNQQAGEECDPPGNMTNGNTCTPTCKVILATTTTGGGTTAPSDPLVNTNTIIGIVVGVVTLLLLIPAAYKGYRWGQKKGYWRPINPAPLKPNPMFNAAPPAATTTTAAVPKLNVAAATSNTVKVPAKPLPVTPTI